MPESSKLTILLLEDQGLVRAGMRELIRISEPRAIIFEASSYENAVEFLEGHSFDFVFLDFDLKAQRTGLDVLRYIREEGIETHSIMLSGRTEKELVLECINAGACGFIPKDMSSDGVFRSALDTVFQGGIFLPASVSASNAPAPEFAGGRHTVSPDSIGVKGRSAEVLFYLCQGLSNKSIASKMNIEEGTIRKDYVPKLFRLFNVSRRTELLLEVSRRGMRVPHP